MEIQRRKLLTSQSILRIWRDRCGCNARDFQFHFELPFGYSWKRNERVTFVTDFDGFWGKWWMCVWQCEQSKHWAWKNEL